MIGYVYDDGGRTEAGYRGEAGDCVTRAIAIATGDSYADVYVALREFQKVLEKPTPSGRRRTPRSGVTRKVYDSYLELRGWEWVPTMGIGTGCQVHLNADELPGGRLIVRVSKHLCAVLYGVIHDTHDPSRDGTRCVYGYWRETT